MKKTICSMKCAAVILAAALAFSVTAYAAPREDGTMTEDGYEVVSEETDTQETEETVSDDLYVTETVSEGEEGISAVSDTLPETAEETVSEETVEVPETEREAVTETEQQSKAPAITVIEPETAEELVIISTTVAEGTVLPVTMILEGETGPVSVTVRQNGDRVRIRPGTYTLKSAVDGNGKALSDGAKLTIAEDGGDVYFDFTKPESKPTDNPFLRFLKSNIFFLPVVLLLYGIYRFFIAGASRH